MKIWDYDTIVDLNRRDEVSVPHNVPIARWWAGLGGFAVCPVDPYDGPVHPNFEEVATSEVLRVEQLWTDAPNGLAGIACGRANLGVLHAEGVQGIRALHAITQYYGPLPVRHHSSDFPILCIGFLL